MRISEAVYRALTGQDAEFLIVADWIEENASGHPEADTYCRRLRDLKNLRVQTVIDVIAKFGTRSERKEICRIQRIALRSRKSGHQQGLRLVPTSINKMESRRLLNYQQGKIIPRESHGGRYVCTHKKTVIANCKKRRVFLHDPAIRNTWWFLQLLRQLMKITQRC